MFVLVFSTTAFATTEFKGKETVNINKANAATFAAYLKGVGANKAKAIVDYRKANGRFKSVEDLKNVPGIGDETFKDVKRKVSTSSGKSVAPEGYKMAETSGNSTSKKSTKKKKTSTRSTKKDSEASSTDKKKSSSKKSSIAKKETLKKKSSKSSDAKEKVKSKVTKKKAKVKKVKTKAKKKTKPKKKKAKAG